MNRSGTALTVLLCSLACWLFVVGTTASHAGDDPWCNSCWCCPLSCPEHAQANDTTDDATNDERVDETRLSAGDSEAVASLSEDETSSETPCESEATHETACGSSFGYEYDTSNDNPESWSIDASAEAEEMTEEVAASDEGTDNPADETATTETPAQSADSNYDAEYQYDGAEYWTSHEATEVEAEASLDENAEMEVTEDSSIATDEMDPASGSYEFSDEYGDESAETTKEAEVVADETRESEAAASETWMYEEESDAETETLADDASESEIAEDAAEAEMTDEAPATDETSESEAAASESWMYEEESDAETEAVENDLREIDEVMETDSDEFEYENHNEYYDSDAMTAEDDETATSDFAEESEMTTDEDSVPVDEASAAVDSEEAADETSASEMESQDLESENISVEEPIDPVIPDPQDEASAFEQLQDRLLRTAGQAISDLRVRVASMAGQLRFIAFTEMGEADNLVPADETQR